MTFNNSGHGHVQYNNLGGNSAPRAPIQAPPKQVALNAPMINRVHNAKPGCSACGKKVA